MRLIICACVALMSGANLTHGQGTATPEAPEAVYAESQELQVRVDAADAEVRDVEYEIKRTRAALANYEYVKAQNASRLEQLEQWVEAR